MYADTKCTINRMWTRFNWSFCIGVKLGLSHWAKKYGLRVFERGEVRGKWRRLYNGEINDLYSNQTSFR
jgi:hypothetical protein